MAHTAHPPDDVIWYPFTPLVGATPPLLISRAQGLYLYTQEGRAIIDGISSWWVNLHGHSHPYLAQALTHQANTLEHVILAGFTHQPALTLSQRLLTLLPPNQAKVFFSDNGSTAVEVGLKLAIQYWHNQQQPRTRIVALQGAYHGDTFGAMSVATRGAFNRPFHELLFPIEFLPFPDDPAVVTQFEQLAQQGDIAAFIYEPLIQGAGGMRMYSPAMLDALLAVAQRHGIITIADEVMTGFGRTGKLFASHHCQHHPDIVCLSKGLTGGALPLAITTCSHTVAQAYASADPAKTFYHGHSFTGNPLACAVANASLDLLLEPDCQQRIVQIQQQHQQFQAQLSGDERVRDIRCCGVVCAIEFNTDAATSYFSPLRDRLHAFFLERNILLRPLGNTLYILPPYIITKDELARIYMAIHDFLEEF